MSSIDTYRKVEKLQPRPVDTMDIKTSRAKENYFGYSTSDIPGPTFRPTNLKPSYMVKWAKREAALVIDYGVSPDVASIQAAAEIVDHYGVACLNDADKEQEVK